MENINLIIEKYGAQIAESLQTTIDKVYPKIFWYIQVTGLIELVQIILISIILVVCFVKTTSSKLFKECWEEAPLLAIFTELAVLVLIWDIVSVFFTDISNAFIKIIVPEYWIINQIINSI